MTNQTQGDVESSEQELMAARVEAEAEAEKVIDTFADRQQSFFFFATMALAAAVAIFGVTAGFIYGDYYGRKHAQYDSPELRQHYAGQCYSYMDQQLKKTIKTTLEKHSAQRDQAVRLEDIRNILVALQMDVNTLGHTTKRKDPKKKLASHP